MAFEATSCHTSLRGAVLVAACWRQGGVWLWSQLDLNFHIGNDNGKFRWEGKDFAKSAREIHLQGTILHAQLANRRGLWCPSSIDLNARIANMDGSLRYFDRWLSLYTKVDIKNGVRHACTHQFEPKLNNCAVSVNGGPFEEKNFHEDTENLAALREQSGSTLSSLDPLEYQALPNPTSIRLLKIESCFDPQAPICCSLIVADLNDSPKYDALSYTWGSPFPNPDDEVCENQTLVC